MRYDECDNNTARVSLRFVAGVRGCCERKLIRGGLYVSLGSVLNPIRTPATGLRASRTVYHEPWLAGIRTNRMIDAFSGLFENKTSDGVNFGHEAHAQ